MPKEEREDIVGLVSLGHFVERRGASWYEGEQRVVMVNGVPLVPYASLKVTFFSHTFSWGDMGSGTRQLALALILNLSKEERALDLDLSYDLAKELLSLLPSSKGFIIPVEAVREWIRAKERGEMYKLYEVAKIIEREKTLGELATGVSVPKEKEKKRMERKKKPSKYPLKELKVGECFFTADERIYHILGVMASMLKKREKKTFALRRVTPKWAKENSVDLPKGGFGVWRTA